MTHKPKRLSIYLDPEIHEVLQRKAAATSRSVSEFVNEALRVYLAEDEDDDGVFEARASESLLSYDEMIKRLCLDRRI